MKIRAAMCKFDAQTVDLDFANGGYSRGPDCGAFKKCESDKMLLLLMSDRLGHAAIEVLDVVEEEE